MSQLNSNQFIHLSQLLDPYCDIAEPIQKTEDELRKCGYKYYETVSTNFEEAIARKKQIVNDNGNIVFATLRKNKSGAYQVWVVYYKH